MEYDEDLQDDHHKGLQQPQQQETYVAQLHQVFTSCDTSRSGYLGHAELRELCLQLHLDDQANLITEHLLGDDPDAKVDFDEFKDKFVCLLAQSVDNRTGQSEDEDENNGELEESMHCSPPEREVSPKYVWGSKKYGRRSRPDIDVHDAENDLPSDFSDSEVFVGQNVNESLVEDPIISLRARAQSGSRIPPSIKRRRRMRSSDDRRISPALSADLADELDSSEDNEDLRSESAGEALQETEEENYLRAILLKLRVGSDGYLNLEGLTRVCEHIGMDMSEEMISQLFEKLDVDQDGKISFEEFLHLFQNGRAASASHTSLPLIASETKSKSICDASEPCLQLPKDRQSALEAANPSDEFSIFSCIDPSNAGYADADVIIELWESLGISNCCSILRELGCSTTSPVCLNTLSSCLEDVLQTVASSELSQVALASYSHELKSLRRSLDQMSIERHKLSEDVAEANMRASLLAQEVDDYHIKLEKSSQNKILSLEKKHQEQIRALQKEQEMERDQFNSQLATIKQTFDVEVTSLKDAEARLREQLELIQKENHNLDQENQDLKQKLTEAHKLNQQQQLEAESMLALKEAFSFEERCKVMAEDLEAIRSENKLLKDHNDEMANEIETLKMQLMAKLNLGASDKPSAQNGLCNSGNKINDDELADHEFENGSASEVVNDPNGSVGADIPNKNCVQTSHPQHPHSHFSHHRRNGSWLSDYIKAPVVKHKGCGATLAPGEEDILDEAGDYGCKLSRSLLCAADMELEARHSKDDPDISKAFDHHASLEASVPQSSAPLASAIAVNLSPNWHLEEDEYLQLTGNKVAGKPELQNPIYDAARLEAMTKKLELTNVFASLRDRIILDYLRDVRSSANGKGSVIGRMLEMILGDDHDMALLAIPNVEEGDVRKIFTGPCIVNDESLWVEVTWQSDGTFGTNINRNKSWTEALQNPTSPYRSSTCHWGHQEVPSGFQNWQHVEVANSEESHPVICRTVQTFSLGVAASNVGPIRGACSINIGPTAPHTKLKPKQESSVEEKGDCCRAVEDCSEPQDEPWNSHLKPDIHKAQLKDACCHVERSRATVGSDEDTSLGLNLGQRDGAPTNVESSDPSTDTESSMASARSRCRSQRRRPSGQLRRNKRSDSWKENGLKDPDSQDLADDELDDTDEELRNVPLVKVAEDLGLRNESCQACAIPKCKKLSVVQCLYEEAPTGDSKHDRTQICSSPSQVLNNNLSSAGGTKSNCLIDVNVLLSLNQHLKQQDNRCRQLEANLKLRTIKSESLLRDTCECYEKEIRFLSELLQKTRDILKQETWKVNEKSEKLLQTDLLVKDLYLENAHLMRNVQYLEERMFKTEKLNYTLQQKCNALNQLLTDMCLNPPTPH